VRRPLGSDRHMPARQARLVKGGAANIVRHVGLPEAMETATVASRRVSINPASPSAISGTQIPGGLEYSEITERACRTPATHIRGFVKSKTSDQNSLSCQTGRIFVPNWEVFRPEQGPDPPDFRISGNHQGSGESRRGPRGPSPGRVLPGYPQRGCSPRSMPSAVLATISCTRKVLAG